MTADHRCKKCKGKEPDVKFYLRKTKTGTYKRHLCTKCWNHYADGFERPSKARSWKSYQAKIKKWRAAGQQTERWILTDSRRDDRRHNRINDLTLDCIRTLISKPCAYCGETELRMTLDRKSNAIGHLQSNVVQACIRCNYARRDMPYEAWLVVAPAIRKARSRGLFGCWLKTPPNGRAGENRTRDLLLPEQALYS